MMGGVLGVVLGWSLAEAVAAVSPLPARISAWSVLVAVMLGATVGVIFGVYPARRAALYDALGALSAQVWMTGADPAPFAEVAARAQTFAISPGRVVLTPRSGGA